MLAALLTDVEGASHAFDRGFVVYSEAAKCELLGVERRMLDDCGAVSRDVADGEMRMVRGEQLVKPGWADRFHDTMKKKKAAAKKDG